MATVYFMCLAGLYGKRTFKATHFGNRPGVLISYITILFLLGTMLAIAWTILGDRAFAIEQGFPGGPTAYIESIYSSAIPVLGNASSFLARWLTDGLMVSKATFHMSSPTGHLIIESRSIVVGLSMTLIIGL